MRISVLKSDSNISTHAFHLSALSPRYRLVLIPILYLENKNCLSLQTKYNQIQSNGPRWKVQYFDKPLPIHTVIQSNASIFITAFSCLILIHWTHMPCRIMLQSLCVFAVCVFVYVFGVSFFFLFCTEINEVITSDIGSVVAMMHINYNTFWSENAVLSLF